MTQDEIIRMAREAGIKESDVVVFGHFPFEFYQLERFAALVAAYERETYRLPKMTEEQIWKCNHDGDGGYHICVEHQNVVDFARAIEREIGFDRANMWLKRIKDAIAAEREACAKVCDTMATPETSRDAQHDFHWAAGCCAAAIRGRIEK